MRVTRAQIDRARWEAMRRPTNVGFLEAFLGGLGITTEAFLPAMLPLGSSEPCPQCEGLRRWERTQARRVSRLEAALRRVRDLRDEPRAVLDVANGALADGPRDWNADSPLGTLAHAGIEARTEERLAVIAWLRKVALEERDDPTGDAPWQLIEREAEAILRGDHRP